MKSIKLLSLLFFVMLIISSCGKDETMEPETPEEMEMEEETPTVTGEIWAGSQITFTKTDDADPEMEANQDRITDNVWITRGNTGGQIYNIKSESASAQATSPAGTEWSLGKAADAATLTFAPFRTTIKPKEVVGKDLVLHLIADDIYLDIKFTEWSESKSGGFSYTRSTK